MVTLPSSIENYLQEAGFTPTEILILKRLLEGQALTLRELASKTGKSTGVLDQATKKLIDRKIVTRENINDKSKYAISSLEAINKWMAKDMDKRHAVLDRKRQDFEAFITTVKHESSRPEMEYFEGLTGIQQAFNKLLAMPEKEWLHFVPATLREEDDPLVEFKVNLFRDRRHQKKFMRVISSDVPLGRRYQNRDMFEYRDTRLVPATDFPVSFEQFIVGDTVACIDVQEQKASFIRYPELANSQRKIFEMMWCRAGDADCSEDECKTSVENPKMQKPDLETKLFSGLREFFMSKSSLLTFGILGVVAALMTWGMYVNNAKLNTERIREQILAVVVTAVNEFDPNDIQELKTASDIHKAEWKKVVTQLQNIRVRNPDLKYAYILRPTSKPNMFEFVADADSIDPYAQIDLNSDGIIDDSDALSPPGDPYDATENPGMTKGMEAPYVYSEPYTDQWGTFISSFAPIVDKNGVAIAVFGVDRVADEIGTLTLKTFSPSLYFIGFFFLFVIIRLAAFHRSLLNQLLLVSRTKKVLVPIACCAFIALAATAGMYKYTLELMKGEIGEKIMSIAATAAPEINAEHLGSLRTANDMKTLNYQRVHTKLNEIRNQHEDIKYVYVMRPTERGSSVWEFVADADSTTGTIDQADSSPTGMQYDLLPYSQEMYKYGLERPTYEPDFVYDQWGVHLSGSAPIIDSQKNTVATLGIDIEISEVYEAVNKKFKMYLWFISIFTGALMLRLYLIWNYNPKSRY